MRLLRLAFLFYTRLPVGNVPHGDSSELARATRYLPFVGWVVGLVTGLCYYGAALLWPGTVAAGIALTAGLLLTGVFHEDGFADVCDGFGGGWTPEQILAIMKDSRLGTYGVVGLILLLGTKWAALSSLSPVAGALALGMAHPLSRVVPVWIVRLLPYARLDETSKAKPVTQGLRLNDLLVANLFGLVPIGVFVALHGFWLALLAVPVAALAGWYMARMYRKRLGGYTGDGLGAAQQLAELGVLLVVAAVLRGV